MTDEEFYTHSRRAQEAAIDLAYAMATGRSFEECLPEVMNPQRSGVTDKRMFALLVMNNIRLVRRVLRDTGASWCGVPPATAEENRKSPANWRDWRAP